MLVTTRTFKSFHSGWTSETVIPLAEGSDRRLTLRTYKGNRGIVSTASVAEHKPDGSVVTVIFQDYHKTLRETAGRATEKSIVSQHDDVLLTINDVLVEARAFDAALGN